MGTPEANKGGCLRWGLIGLAVIVGLGVLGAVFGDDSETVVRTASVPNVVGEHLDQAKDVLDDAGFGDVDSYDTVEDRTQIIDSNWIVTEQSPSAGTSTKTDANVRLGVRKDSDEPSSSTPATAPAPPEDPYDIQTNRCSRDSIGGLHYTGVIRNTSSSTKSYQISVEFVADTGVRLDDGVDYVNDVAPGQSAAWEAIGITDYSNRFTCRVTNVDWS